MARIVDGPTRRGRLPIAGRNAMLLMLTWAAGSIDAISYLGLEHVFTAMMTGNTVLLALALGQGELLAVLRSVLALAGFVAGAAAGATIAEVGGRRQPWPPAVTAALALEALVLGLFTATWHLTGTPRGAGAVHVLIVLSAFAMGVQAAAVRSLGVPGIGTTYITGTLTSLVADVVGWARARTAAAPMGSAEPASDGWENRIGLLAGVFGVYALGALVDAVLQVRAPWLAALSPLIAVSLVVLNACVDHCRRTEA